MTNPVEPDAIRDEGSCADPQDEYTDQWQAEKVRVRKRVSKRKRKKRRKKSKKTEFKWDSKAESKPKQSEGFQWWQYGAIAIIFVILGVGVFMSLTGPAEQQVIDQPLVTLPVEESPEKEDELTRFIREAKIVAHTFISAIDEEKRLSLVRDIDSVRSHLDRYPVDAREFSIVQMKMRGCSEVNGVRRCAFTVQLTNGNFRLLNVLETEDGLKVDWDSYARYCSASWEDLLSGKAIDAEVRVFVMPGDHPVAPFADASKWTCFQLVDPGSNRRLYAYAPAGSRVARQMLSGVMRTRSSRQHMTLKIKSINGSGKNALFVVDELLAMGWVSE